MTMYLADSSSELANRDTKMLRILPTKRKNIYHYLNFSRIWTWICIAPLRGTAKSSIYFCEGRFQQDRWKRCVLWHAACQKLFEMGASTRWMILFSSGSDIVAKVALNVHVGLYCIILHFGPETGKYLGL
jgi:hypothetical protein